MTTKEKEFATFKCEMVDEWWEFKLVFDGQTQHISRVHRLMVKSDTTRELYQQTMMQLVAMSLEELADNGCKFKVQ